MIEDVNCYNMSNGGVGLNSENSKLILSRPEVIKKRDIWFKENKEFMSEMMKERWKSEEYRNKMKKYKEKSSKCIKENMRKIREDDEKYKSLLKKRKKSLQNRTVIYKKGVEGHKRVKNDVLEFYIQEGWELGKKEKVEKTLKKIKRKFIHNEETKSCLLIDVEELNRYLQCGWKLGKKYINTGTNGTKWINNGQISKSVKIESLNDYLDNGWCLGNLHTKIRNKLAGEKISKEKMLLYCEKHNIKFKNIPKTKTKLIFYNKNKNSYKSLIYRGQKQLDILYENGYVWNGEIEND